MVVTDQAASSGAMDDPALEGLTLEDRVRLRDSLDDIPGLDHETSWVKVLRLVRLDGAGPSLSPFAPDFDTFDILEACIGVDDGLRRLAQAIRVVLGRTPPVLAFTDIVDELESLGQASTLRERVVSLIESAPIAAHSEALRHLAMAEHADKLRDITDPVEAYQLLSDDASGSEGSGGILYLELIGHQLDNGPGAELHRVIRQLTRYSLRSRDAVAELHRSLSSGGLDQRQQVATPDRPSEAPRPVDGDNKMITVTVHESEARVRDQTAPAATPMTVWGWVPPRNVNFTGRQRMLEAVHESLRRASSTTLVPQAVHGLGGVGKTQLANEYAYRYQESYDLIWWVPSTDETLIRRSLVSLARRLNLREGVDTDDTIGLVLDALRRGEPHKRWLLIFDNAGTPEAIQKYWPQAGAGHILVTSRSSGWMGQEGTISVDVFTANESADMLEKRWPDLDRNDALELAARLGHLPLALEQAAAVHNESGMTFDEYMRALEETPFSVLAEGTPPGYGTSLAQTFQVAYRELKGRSEAAAQLFGMCALMSPQPISVSLLIYGRGADLPMPLSGELRTEMTRRKAIRDMGNHALAQLDPGRNLITIHNLVRDLLREELSDEERDLLTRAAHNLLALANPGVPDDPANWSALAQISPHVVPSGILYSPSVEARTVFLDQIRYQYAIGDYMASRDLGEMAVRAWTEMLGPDDVMTMLASRHLANSLRERGEFERVRQIDHDTWERMKRVLGERHEHTLATANSVGADLRRQGAFLEAKALDEENLDAYRATLGDDDIATRRSMNNLAVDMRLLGRFEEARQLDEANTRKLADMYGDDDVRAFDPYGSLARDLAGLGQYAKALSLQMGKLRIHEETMQEGHSELLRAKRNVAILLRKNGNYGQALEEAEDTYNSYQTRFGAAYDQTPASALTLANTLRVVDELPRAHDMGKSAVEGFRNSLGHEHPLTMAATVDLAIVLRLQGDTERALELNREALSVLREKLGGDHQWTLCALTGLASIMAAQGETTEARKLSDECLNRSRRVRGEDHPYTLACAANLSLDLENVGEHVEVSALRRGTIASMRKVLGERHPEVVNVGLNIRAECDIEPPSI
jgi:tetratricopeptide (TPR) repeat protein